MLFTVVNLCRRRGINPEIALHGANQKFLRRFTALEELLAAAGITLQDASAGDFERAWNTVKEQERLAGAAGNEP